MIHQGTFKTLIILCLQILNYSIMNFESLHWKTHPKRKKRKKTLGSFTSGTQPSSHSKYQRKISLGFWQGKGETNYLGICRAFCSFNEGCAHMQSTSWETLGWKKHKLESRLPGEISITSDMQITSPLWQTVKRNWRASWWKWKRRVKQEFKTQH